VKAVPTTPPVTTEIARIVDELQREHDGDPWHGSPLQAILEGIDATRANARPIPGAHSVWELVLHMTGWKNETARRLAGAVACMPIEGDWPEVGDPTDKRWHEALARLESAHVNLIAAVKALPENKLYEPTNDTRSAPLGTGVSHYVLLHGIVQHDVYHAGQIAILKKGL
jgi:uncharacterized damage-inducible protein DinB